MVEQVKANVKPHLPAPPPDGVLEPQHPADHPGLTQTPVVVTNTPPRPVVVDLHRTLVLRCLVAIDDQPHGIIEGASGRSWGEEQ